MSISVRESRLAYNHNITTNVLLLPLIDRTVRRSCVRNTGVLIGRLSSDGRCNTLCRLISAPLAAAASSNSSPAKAMKPVQIRAFPQGALSGPLPRRNLSLLDLNVRTRWGRDDQ